MADDSIKTIDDILSQADIEKFDAQWRADIKRQFLPIKARGWLDKSPPARRVLLELTEQKNAQGLYTQEPLDFLALGIVGMLAATGGVGKTQALIQLALAVASGTMWLDTFDVVEPGHVAVLLAEESAEEAWRRFYYSTRALNLSDARLAMLEERIWVLPMFGLSARMIDATTRETTQVFEDFQSALHNAGVDWKLIILDPASRLMPEDGEFDSAAATDFIALLEGLSQTSRGKPTILLSHHTRKQGSGKVGVRGSSALTDGVRWLTTLKPYGVKAEGGIDEEGEGRVLLKLQKSNYGKAGLKRPFAFDAQGSLRPLTPTEKTQETPPPKPRGAKGDPYDNQ